MKNLLAVMALIMSFSSIAADSVECDNKQVIGYETSADIIETSKDAKLLYLNSGSSRKLYLRLEGKAVDSRTLGTIEQDVTGHYTKKGKGITCFKQEVEAQECATYSCNIQVK